MVILLLHISGMMLRYIQQLQLLHIYLNKYFKQDIMNKLDKNIEESARVCAKLKTGFDLEEESYYNSHAIKIQTSFIEGAKSEAAMNYWREGWMPIASGRTICGDAWIQAVLKTTSPMTEMGFSEWWSNYMKE